MIRVGAISLEALREKRGVTIAVFAESLGISATRYRQILARDPDIGAALPQRVAARLRCAPHEIAEFVMPGAWLTTDELLHRLAVLDGPEHGEVSYELDLATGLVVADPPIPPQRGGHAAEGDGPNRRRLISPCDLDEYEARPVLISLGDLRRDRGETVAEFGRFLGVSELVCRQLLTGNPRVPPDVRERVAARLGLTVEEVWECRPQPERPRRRRRGYETWYVFPNSIEPVDLDTPHRIYTIRRRPKTLRRPDAALARLTRHLRPDRYRGWWVPRPPRCGGA